MFLINSISCPGERESTQKDTCFILVIFVILGSEVVVMCSISHVCMFHHTKIPDGKTIDHN